MKYHTPRLSGPAPQFSLLGTVPALSVQHIAAGYLVYSKWPGFLGATSLAVGSPFLQGPCFNGGKVGHVKKCCPLLQSLAQSGK